MPFAVPARLVAGIAVAGAVAAAALALGSRPPDAGAAPVALAASAAPGTAPSVVTGGTVALTAFGAVCDGTRDDRPALLAAVTAVRAAGGGTITVPAGTCRIVATAAAPWVTLDGAITVRGTSSRSALRLDTDAPGAYRALLRLTGRGAVVHDVRLERVPGASGVMVDVHSAVDATLSAVDLDGGAAPGASFHGVRLTGEAGQPNRNLRILGSRVRRVDFGLYQDNASRAVTHGVTVRSSRFTANRADDLEFNAPSTTLDGVLVERSVFQDNRSDGRTSGFAVGLAHVSDAVVRGNVFAGYRASPVHVEDRSARVLISRNRFVRAGTAPTSYAAHVLVITGSTDVRVVANRFDARTNTNRLDCVYVGPGGAGTAPQRVVVTRNAVLPGARTRLLGRYGGAGVVTG